MTQFHDAVTAALHWFDYQMSQEMWWSLVIGWTFFTALMWAVWRSE